MLRAAALLCAVMLGAGDRGARTAGTCGLGVFRRRRGCWICSDRRRGARRLGRRDRVARIVTADALVQPRASARPISGARRDPARSEAPRGVATSRGGEAFFGSLRPLAATIANWRPHPNG